MESQVFLVAIFPSLGCSKQSLKTAFFGIAYKKDFIWAFSNDIREFPFQMSYNTDIECTPISTNNVTSQQQMFSLQFHGPKKNSVKVIHFFISFKNH